ncbi:hypothetical protein ACQR1Y_11920 [Bradyrhizobium sp. HKCCYLRH3099]|uniref:hypothetical protein n=1 Tax=unclassified Bradyrhizobium TaxID=2631580 RepID=UPI003EBD56C2
MTGLRSLSKPMRLAALAALAVYGLAAAAALIAAVGEAIDDKAEHQMAIEETSR